MNILCTICSDLLTQSESIYVTKCGHIFHQSCLSQWITRSKSCPQCRFKVTDSCMFRLYPTVSSEQQGTDTVETLQSKLDDAKLEIRQQKAELKTANDKLEQRVEELKMTEKTLQHYMDKLMSKTSAVSALSEQIDYLKVENKRVKKLTDENESLKKKLHTLEGLQTLLNSVSKDVESMLQGYSDPRTIAIFATALKRALMESEQKKNEYRDKLHGIKQHVAAIENDNANLQTRMIHLEDKLASTERLLKDYQKKRQSCDHDKTTSKAKDSPKKRSSSEAEQPGTSRSKRQRKDSKDPVPGTSGISGKAGNSGKDGSSAADTSANSSINTMVKNIEDADSPYLHLRQGTMALRTINRPTRKPENNTITSMEFKILNKTRSNENHSIFNSNKNLTILPSKDIVKETDTSYDGLGGHSKLDVFPQSKPVLKNCIPKLTAKHKLKRPATAGSQDITKMFEKIVEK